MTNTSEFTIYAVFIVYGCFYILIAPYIGSKILVKSGSTERKWFFILILLSIYALLAIAIFPKLIIVLNQKDIRNLVLLALSYIVTAGCLFWFLCITN